MTLQIKALLSSLLHMLLVSTHASRLFSPMFEQETLTGFKWMGNRARDLLDQDNTVLFAFEEAIGMQACTRTHTQTYRHISAHITAV